MDDGLTEERLIGGAFVMDVLPGGLALDAGGLAGEGAADLSCCDISTSLCSPGWSGCSLCGPVLLSLDCAIVMLLH